MTTHRHCCCDDEISTEYGLLIKQQRNILPLSWSLSQYNILDALYSPYGEQAILQKYTKADVSFVQQTKVELAPGLSGISGGLFGLSYDVREIVKNGNTTVGYRDWIKLEKVNIESTPPIFLGSSEDLFVNYLEISNDFIAGIALPGKPAKSTTSFNLTLPHHLQNENVIVLDFQPTNTFLDQFYEGNGVDRDRPPGLKADPDLNNEADRINYFNNIYTRRINGPQAFFRGDTLLNYQNRGIISDVYTTLLNHVSTRKIFNQYIPPFTGRYVPTSSGQFNFYPWNAGIGTETFHKWWKAVYTTSQPFYFTGGEACCASTTSTPSPGCDIVRLDEPVQEKTQVNTKINVKYSKGMSVLDSILKQDIKEIKKTPNHILSKKPLWFFASANRGDLQTKVDVINQNLFYVYNLVQPIYVLYNQILPSICLNWSPPKIFIIESSEFCPSVSEPGNCCITGGSLSTYRMWANYLNTTSFYGFVSPENRAQPIYFIVKFCKIKIKESTETNNITDSNSQGNTDNPEKTVLLIKDTFQITPLQLGGPGAGAFDQIYDNTVGVLPDFRLPTFLGKVTNKVPDTPGPLICCGTPPPIEPIGKSYRRVNKLTIIDTRNSTCCPVQPVPCNDPDPPICVTEQTYEYTTGFNDPPPVPVPSYTITEYYCCANGYGSFGGVDLDPNAPCYRQPNYPDPNPTIQYPKGTVTRIYEQSILYNGIIYPGGILKRDTGGEGQNIEVGCKSNCSGPPYCQRQYTTTYTIQNDAPEPADCCSPCIKEVTINPNLQAEEDALYYPDIKLYPWKVSDDFVGSGVISGRTGPDIVTLIPNRGISSNTKFLQNYLISFMGERPDNTDVYWLQRESGSLNQWNFRNVFVNYAFIKNKQVTRTVFGGNLLSGGQARGSDTLSPSFYGPLATLKGPPWNTLKEYVKDVYECSKPGNTGARFCEKFAGAKIDWAGRGLGVTFPIITQNYQKICKRLVDWFGFTGPTEEEKDQELAIDIFPEYPVYTMSNDPKPNWCFPLYGSYNSVFEDVFWRFSNKRNGPEDKN